MPWKTFSFPRVSYITNTHNYKDIRYSIAQCGGGANPIKIGDCSWIGINCTILDGTVLGNHCVVGANSVVKGKFPGYCVIAGSPARIVKKYDFGSGKWLPYKDGEKK